MSKNMINLEQSKAKEYLILLRKISINLGLYFILLSLMYAFIVGNFYGRFFNIQFALLGKNILQTDLLRAEEIITFIFIGIGSVCALLYSVHGFSQIVTGMYNVHTTQLFLKNLRGKYLIILISSLLCAHAVRYYFFNSIIYTWYYLGWIFALELSFLLIYSYLLHVIFLEKVKDIRDSIMPFFIENMKNERMVFFNKIMYLVLTLLFYLLMSTIYIIRYYFYIKIAQQQDLIIGIIILIVYLCVGFAIVIRMVGSELSECTKKMIAHVETLLHNVSDASFTIHHEHDLYIPLYLIGGFCNVYIHKINMIWQHIYKDIERINTISLQLSAHSDSLQDSSHSLQEKNEKETFDFSFLQKHFNNHYMISDKIEKKFHQQYTTTSNVYQALEKFMHNTQENNQYILNQEAHFMENLDGKLASLQKIHKDLNSLDGIYPFYQRISQQINELHGFIQSISEQLHKVYDISEQTNVLAVNASIEAARTGTNGKGFAVIAHAVKDLADTTTRTVDGIAQIIGRSTTILEDSLSDIEENAYSAQQSQNIIDDDSRIINSMIELCTENTTVMQSIIQLMRTDESYLNHMISIVDKMVTYAKDIELLFEQMNNEQNDIQKYINTLREKHEEVNIIIAHLAGIIGNVETSKQDLYNSLSMTYFNKEDNNNNNNLI